MLLIRCGSRLIHLVRILLLHPCSKPDDKHRHIFLSKLTSKNARPTHLAFDPDVGCFSLLDPLPTSFVLFKRGGGRRFYSYATRTDLTKAPVAASTWSSLDATALEELHGLDLQRSMGTKCSPSTSSTGNEQGTMGMM